MVPDSNAIMIVSCQMLLSKAKGYKNFSQGLRLLLKRQSWNLYSMASFSFWATVAHSCLLLISFFFFIFEILIEAYLWRAGDTTTNTSKLPQHQGCEGPRCLLFFISTTSEVPASSKSLAQALEMVVIVLWQKPKRGMGFMKQTLLYPWCLGLPIAASGSILYCRLLYVFNILYLFQFKHNWAL